MKTKMMVAMVLMVGCSSRYEEITEFQAARMYARAICTRVLDCQGTSQTYLDACVEKVMDQLDPKPSGTATYTCNQGETEDCANALQGMSCQQIKDGQTSGESLDACRKCGE